jgi:hypothetical protein
MDQNRTRVLNAFPYPVTYPYSLIFDASDTPSNRRWALCFTVYQLLRLVCLPLVSQYLRDGIDTKTWAFCSGLRGWLPTLRPPTAALSSLGKSCMLLTPAMWTSK